MALSWKESIARCLEDRVEHHHNHVEGQQTTSKWDRNMKRLSSAPLTPHSLEGQAMCFTINDMIKELNRSSTTFPVAEKSRFYTELVALIEKASANVPKSGVLILKCQRMLCDLHKADFTTCQTCLDWRSDVMDGVIPAVCHYLNKYYPCLLNPTRECHRFMDFPTGISISFLLVELLVRDDEVYREQVFNKGLPEIMIKYAPHRRELRSIACEIDLIRFLGQQEDVSFLQKNQLFKCLLAYVESYSPPFETPIADLVAVFATLPEFFVGFRTRINDFMAIRTVREIWDSLPIIIFRQPSSELQRFLDMVKPLLETQQGKRPNDAIDQEEAGSSKQARMG